MENNKKIIITVLSVLVCIMAVGYSLLAQELTINGRASIDSTWKVEITNITSKDVVGDAVNKTEPTYTATTANFSVGFTQPGDSITYDIEITNNGTLDAVVESIIVNTGNNPAITYTTSGLKRGDKIAKNNGTNTLTVKVEYDSSITFQSASTTNNIRVTINYQQDLGQVPAYEAYSIGDTVNFAGSNWKVIKASTTEEDYVTLMKETVLTNAELGDYAYNSTYDTMIYHESSNVYATSKVKEMLETRYLPTIGENNLKKVDGYKIRLITVDELESNLGYTKDTGTNVYNYNLEITPSWVYQNFGENQNNVSGYWTMTPYSDDYFSYTWHVTPFRIVYNHYGDVTNNHIGVRPVINLLKSSIE